LRACVGGWNLLKALDGYPKLAQANRLVGAIAYVSGVACDRQGSRLGKPGNPYGPGGEAMRVLIFACGPVANESERKAIEHLKNSLQSEPGDAEWSLLTNLAFSVTHQFQSDEIDVIAIGPPGARVIEVKHWTPGWGDSHKDLVEQEADKLTNKARKIGTALRRMIHDLPRVDGAFLLFMLMAQFGFDDNVFGSDLDVDVLGIYSGHAELKPELIVFLLKFNVRFPDQLQLGLKPVVEISAENLAAPIEDLVSTVHNAVLDRAEFIKKSLGLPDRECR